jgi:hypothetical protein
VPHPSILTLNGGEVEAEKTGDAWTLRVPAGEYTVVLR